MAPKGTEKGLALLLVVMLWNGAAAQSGCTSALISLSPCLNYVGGNSSTPSPSCITLNQTLALGLPGVCNVQTPPLSRCNAASAPTASAATAKSTPVGSPPPVVSPVGSPPPADSPESVPVGSPSPADSPSDSSNETLPENQTEPSESSNPSAGMSRYQNSALNSGASSGGSTIKSPLQVAVFLLFIVSCASSATIF
ncbi:hypothetical protein C3L33_04117, partial [Rhododendron williamsianum]